jgi:selenide,water dikinase
MSILVALHNQFVVNEIQINAIFAHDVLSLDIGITTGLPEVPGFADHGLAAKPMAALAARWEGFVAEARPHPKVAVIGPVMHAALTSIGHGYWQVYGQRPALDIDGQAHVAGRVEAF